MDLAHSRDGRLDAITTDYQVSVITSMPKSHAQNLTRETWMAAWPTVIRILWVGINERVEVVAKWCVATTAVNTTPTM
jgi:hypothetical protein